MPPSTPPIPPGGVRCYPSIPMKYHYDSRPWACGLPNAWRHAHSTVVMSEATADRSQQVRSLVRTRPIAVLILVAAVAGSAHPRHRPPDPVSGVVPRARRGR